MICSTENTQENCIQKYSIVSVFYKVVVAVQKKIIYLAIWNQVSFAVQMNTKCLDINQNLKNSFLTDSTVKIYDYWQGI